MLFRLFYQNDLSSFQRSVSKCNVNAVDDFGRTVLHLAASANKVEFVRALLSAPAIDLLAADFESGWTALHRALYAGHIAIAQLLIAAEPATIRAKDRESNPPFDVLNATLPDLPATGPGELFMFGSNANHTLGFNDADDRAKPERVFLPPPSNRVSVTDVQMAKLHTVLVTAEPANNVYVCGFGADRLGLQVPTSARSTGQTQFTFRSPDFASSRVICVAAALDHTLAVTDTGDCYSWGSNRHGQLGYPGDSSNAPRKIPGLKRQHVIGVAASRVHSVAYTSTHVFTWGANLGQLGVPVADQVELHPRQVTLPGPVLSVTAVDNATVFLLANTDVVVFANQRTFKVVFPLERFKDQFAVFRPRNTYEKNTIAKLVSGGSNVYAVSSLGDVYSFEVNSKTDKHVPIKTVWSVRRNHLAVRDLSVDLDGQIIVCTESGSVWRKTKRATAKSSHSVMSDYKFSRVSHLTNVVAVRSNMFGACAAIRTDPVPPPVEIESHDLVDDLEKLICFVELDDTTDSPRSFKSTLRLLQSESLHEIVRDRVAAKDGDIFLACSDSDILITAHKFILARTKALDVLKCDGQVLSFDTGLLSVLIFTYFVYTGSLLPVWDLKSSKFTQAKTDLFALARTLKLKPLESALYFLHTEAMPSLEWTSEWTDLEVRLKDGEVRCHAAILSCRSEFFHTFVSRWRTSSVDMTHVPYHIFEIVLKYIYGHDDIFDQTQVTADDTAGFTRLVLQVLAVATELLIPPLAQICQSVLLGYVTVRNATELLAQADLYSAQGLKHSILTYISMNLECMLEDKLLDSLDPQLCRELEAVVKSRQKEKLPITKSGVMLDLLEQRNPTLHEARRKEKERLCMAPDRRRSSAQRHAADFIFEMEDTDESPFAKSPAAARRKSSTPRADRRPSLASSPSPVTPGPATLVPSEASTPSSTPGSYATPVSSTPVLSAPTSSTPGSSRPWKVAPAKVAPLDFSTLRKEVSPKPTVSGISLALQQQQQQQQQQQSQLQPQSQSQPQPPQQQPLPQPQPQQPQQQQIKSQKERKKQLQDAKPSPSSSSASPWQTPGPWQTPERKAIIIPSPQTSFATTVKSSSSPSAPPKQSFATAVRSTPVTKQRIASSPHALSPRLSSPLSANISLQEIIQQQKEQQNSKTRKVTSVMDLFEEEEFKSWWEAESKRVQEAERRERECKSERTANAKPRGGTRGRRKGVNSVV